MEVRSRATLHNCIIPIQPKAGYITSVSGDISDLTSMTKSGGFLIGLLVSTCFLLPQWDLVSHLHSCISYEHCCFKTYLTFFSLCCCFPDTHRIILFLVWDKDQLVSRLGNTMYKMNNHNKVIQLELMAVSSVCVGKKSSKKVSNNTFFVCILWTEMGSMPAMSLAFLLAISFAL